MSHSQKTRVLIYDARTAVMSESNHLQSDRLHTDFSAHDLYRVIKQWMENKDPEFGKARGEGGVQDVKPLREGYGYTNTEMNGMHSLLLRVKYSEECHLWEMVLQVADKIKDWHERSMWINCNPNCGDEEPYDISIRFFGNDEVWDYMARHQIDANKELFSNLPLTCQA